MDKFFYLFSKFLLTPDRFRVIIDLRENPAGLRDTHVDFTEFRYCTAGARGDSLTTEFSHCGAECASPKRRAGVVLQFFVVKKKNEMIWLVSKS